MCRWPYSIYVEGLSGLGRTPNINFLFNQKKKKKNEDSYFWNLAWSCGNVEEMTNKGQGIKASLGLEDEKVEELKIFSLILYVFG